jgi:hypothetical protein
MHKASLEIGFNINQVSLIPFLLFLFTSSHIKVLPITFSCPFCAKNSALSIFHSFYFFSSTSQPLEEEQKKSSPKIVPTTFRPDIKPITVSLADAPKPISVQPPKPTTFKPHLIIKESQPPSTEKTIQAPKYTHVKSVTIISTSPEEISIRPQRINSVGPTHAPKAHKATTVVKAVTPKGEKKAIVVNLSTTPFPPNKSNYSVSTQLPRTSPKLSIKNSVLDLSPPVPILKVIPASPFDPYSSLKSATPAPIPKAYPSTPVPKVLSSTTTTTTDRNLPALVSPSNDLLQPKEQKVL